MSKHPDSRQAIAAELLLDLTRGSYEHLSQVIEATIARDYSDVFGDSGVAFKVLATYPDNVIAVNDVNEWRRVRYGIMEATGDVVLLESEPLRVPVVSTDDVGAFLDESVAQHTRDLASNPERAEARLASLRSYLESDDAVEHRAALWVSAEVTCMDTPALDQLEQAMHDAGQAALLEGDAADAEALEALTEGDFGIGDLDSLSSRMLSAIDELERLVGVVPRGSVVQSLAVGVLAEARALQSSLETSLGVISRPRLITITLESVAHPARRCIRAARIISDIARSLETPPRADTGAST